MPEDEIEYDHYEVERHGDDVWLILSTDDDVDYRVLQFSPTDALTLGMALAQAGSDQELPPRRHKGILP